MEKDVKTRIEMINLVYEVSLIKHWNDAAFFERKLNILKDNIS